MQALRHLLLPVAILFQLTLTIETVRAQSFSSYEPPAFKVSVQRENVERQPAPFRVFVTIGTNKFTFVTPDGFQVKDDPALRRVILINASQTCSMVIDFGISVPEGKSAQEIADCRDLLLKRFPNAKILNEFLAIAGASAPAFDLQFAASGGTIQTARVAFIPSIVGTLEFRTTGTTEVEISFNTVLRTFSASDSNGKLDIPPPVSDLM